MSGDCKVSEGWLGGEGLSSLIHVGCHPFFVRAIVALDIKVAIPGVLVWRGGSVS